MPSLQINNFPDQGILSNIFSTKSAFDGGAASGTGNQNYSYKVDYGINEKTYVSGYLSEADDPYYYKIKNIGDLPSKNFWRIYGLSFNRKLFNNYSSKLDLSLNSSIELWDLATLYKKNNEANGYFSDRKFIGSISTPLTYKVRILIYNCSKIIFSPKKIGTSSIENFTIKLSL